jgi:hypothetical protein
VYLLVCELFKIVQELLTLYVEFGGNDIPAACFLIVKHSQYWQVICLRKLEEAIIANSEVWELAGSEKRLSAISLQILSSSYCGHHSSPHLTISRKNR